MTRCLSTRKAEAQYVKKIQGYYHKNSVDLGMHHFQTSTQSFYINAICLYDILMLCRETLAVRRIYLNKTEWM
ncbi:hypothetical protein Bca4012_092712 [Brassica carinata]